MTIFGGEFVLGEGYLIKANPIDNLNDQQKVVDIN